MSASNPMPPDFLFLALIGAIFLFVLLQSRSILKQKPIAEKLEEDKSKISSLSNLIKTMTDDQEVWAETVEKTQENLVRMFIELEEAKKLAGLPLLVKEGQTNRLAEAKEQFTKLLAQKDV
ncbi:hypothetical protein [Acaryochloris marina]|uniref:hypothetical protein n=1 Tax=Acaryochloris marina TaxID=155978 RepID=UPI001BB0752E|nr:hypothetical protein [Acaryochloris marina]QUY45910.1 hypothetical protein I1H34_28840 [Acaryochloris marina S15]